MGKMFSDTFHGPGLVAKGKVQGQVGREKLLNRKSETSLCKRVTQGGIFLLAILETEVGARKAGEEKS